jgi:uncharacterized phiE125 gp8 family phage protein
MADTRPISVEEFKEHARIDFESDDDIVLPGVIDAATAWAEHYNGRKFLTASCTETWDVFPATIRLRHAPVIAVQSITYIDENGTEQTLSSALYRVDITSDPARITPAYDESWPDTRAVTGAITVTYTAGYGTSAADVPAIKRNAIMLIASALYENREEISPLRVDRIPFGALNLLGIDRRVPV